MMIILGFKGHVLLQRVDGIAFSPSDPISNNWPDSSLYFSTTHNHCISRNIYLLYLPSLLMQDNTLNLESMDSSFVYR